MRFRALPLLALFFCAGAPAGEGLDAAEQAYAQGKYHAAGIQFQILADSGDAQAQFRLAQLHAEGKGVAQNFDTAIAWYRKAAAQGHAGATRVLTELALQGSTLLAPRPQPETRQQTVEDEGPPKRIEVTVKQRPVDRELVIWPALPRKPRHRVKQFHGKSPPPIGTPKPAYMPAPGTRFH